MVILILVNKAIEFPTKYIFDPKAKWEFSCNHTVQILKNLSQLSLYVIFKA